MSGQRYTRRACVAALLLALVGCSDTSHSAPAYYGIERRVEVAPLPLPSGLPAPIPVSLTNAFPALLFDRPLFLTSPPDGTDRIVVVEQTGRLQVFANDQAVTSTTTMLDLSTVVQFGGEEGLLGLAFHPDYSNTGWLYVYYTRGGPRRSVLSRFTISGDPNVVDAASEVVLLQVEQPFENHNSGSLAFGPDGKLYVACGDGGAGNDPFNNSQDPTTLLGNVLRLEDDGSIPADNPFVGSTAGERGEIWAYGLRNPWRMSFDTATGRLWLGDVGQGAVEEIDIIERGGNYGWRVFEGNRENINPQNLSPNAFTAPVHSYTHADGVSVTGGYVYRGTAVPTLQGAYVYADFGSGNVWALVYDGSQAVANTQIATTIAPASFGEDQDGELYVCCFDGYVRKLVPDPTTTPVAPLPTMLSATGLFANTATLTPAPGVIEYTVRAPLWSDGARKRRWMALPGTARIDFDPTAAFDFPIGTALVKHFEIDTAPGITQRLETRVLLRQLAGWTGFTYRWNEAGTDAALVADPGESFSFDFTEPNGSVSSRNWTIPGRASCLTCHTAAAGRVLGVRAEQLNTDFAFPLRNDNQLRVWNHIGLFTADIGDETQFAAYADPADVAASLDDRARSYLAVNCGNCHLPLGPTPVDLDLRYETMATARNLFGVTATNPVPGGAGLRATAGNSNLSDLWLRLMRRDAYGMPPLGSHVVDDAGVALIGAWIDSDPTIGQ